MRLTESIRKATSAPWDLHEWGPRAPYRGNRRRPPQYPGLSGSRHDEAVSKGYVDLGLIDPKVASGNNRWFGRTFMEALASILRDRKIAFVKDPEGILKNSDLKRIPKSLIERIQVPYAEALVMASEVSETDGGAEAAALGATLKRLEAIKVTVTPVRGQTSPGYKITLNPTVAQALRGKG